jgi:LysM repeat protein
MNLLAAVALMVSAATIQVELAPDQPLAYVYVDDPLILELRTDEDVEADVTVMIQGEHQESAQEFRLGGMPLRANSSRWCPVPGVPAERGIYNARIITTINGVEQSTTTQFYRIDRPPRDSALPLYAHGLAHTDQALLALKSVAVNTIRLNAGDAAFEELLAKAIAADFDIIVHIDLPDADAAAALVQRVGQAHCENMVRWEIDPNGDTARLGRVAQAIRDTGCGAPLAVVVPDAQTLWNLFQSDAGHDVREAVLLNDAPTAEELEAFRRLTEHAGYEAWKLSVLGRGVPAGTQQTGRALVRQLFQNMAHGVKTTGFDSSLLYDGELQSTVVYLNGLGHRLVSFDFVGSLSETGPTTYLFRNGSAWLLVFWVDKGEQEVRVPVAEGQTVLLSDALNNTLEVPQAKEGSLRLTARSMPQYLTGSGGPVLGMAARHQARHEASSFLANQEFAGALPPELNTLVGAIQRDVGGASSRIHFFALIRALPDLEERWHQGQLPQHVAATALAQLTRLARSMATVEEDLGEEFVEPIENTRAQGEENQSQYLTGSTGTSEANERGDWLVNEVRRLLDETVDLETAGRVIEAGAVANLAEWRSRGLQFVAKPTGGRPEEIVTAAAIPTPPPAPPPAAAPVEEPVPQPDLTPAPPAAAVGLEPGQPEGTVKTVHALARGENPSVVAKKYGVTTADVLAWNKLAKNARLKVGQELVVYTADPAATPAPAAVAAVAPEAAAPAEQYPALPRDPGQPEETQKVLHVAASGDTPGGIAQKYNVKLADFRKWNKLRNNTRIRLGREYVVYAPQAPGTAPAPAPEAAPEAAPPAAPEATAAAAEAPAPVEAAAEPAPAEPAPVEASPEPAPEPAEGVTHTIARGDTPAKIAKRYDISVADLLRLNKVKSTNLKVGQSLVIREGGAAPAQAPEAEPEAAAPEEETAPKQEAPARGSELVHTVQKGETTKSIAAKYGMSEAEFRQLNGIRAGAQLRGGRQYKVVQGGGNASAAPAPESPAVEPAGDAPTGTRKVTHTVGRGDNPYTISKKYGVELADFLKWNKLGRNKVLHVGEKYVVYVKR